MLLLSSLLAAISCIAFNLLLIPRFDAYGAAAAVLGTDADDAGAQTVHGANKLAAAAKARIDGFLDGVDDAAIEMTMDNAGNINMADFLFHPFNYDTFAAGNPIAKYTNVVLTRKAGDAGIENMVTVNKTVEGIFDLLGRKLDVITAPGIYIVNGKKVVVK